MQHGYGTPAPGVWPQAAMHSQMNGPAFKKAKTGGMVTTKYAPPLGYAPPAAQPAPYSAYSYGSAGYNAQQAQYAAYNQQAYAQWAQYAQAGYPGYQMPPAYSGVPYQYYQQPAIPQAYVPPVTAAPQSAYPSTAFAGQWPVPPQATGMVPFTAKRRHQSVPSITTEHSFENSEPPRQSGINDDLDESHEDYCEYTRPCYYASRESEIVKELSIGLVHAKTALPAHTALPATWTEANEIALRPIPPERFESDRCLSAYHTNEAKQDELRPVRETELWDDVQDDMIFKHLPWSTTELLDKARLRSQYRNRSDIAWLENRHSFRRSSTQQPSVSRKASNQPSGGNKKRIFSQTESAEDADGAKKRSRQAAAPAGSDVEMTQAVPQDISSIAAKSYDRSTIEPRRVETQDEVLARLGVTGPPKPVRSVQQETNESDGHASLGASRIPDASQQIASHASTNHTVELDGAMQCDEPPSARPTEVKIPPVISIDKQATPAVEPQQQPPGRPNESRWTRMARECQLGT